MADLKYFSGTLILSDAPENMNSINYGVVDLVDGVFHSITNELERIYNSDTKYVRIAVKKFNENKQLNRMGNLHKGIDKYGVECWHIGSYPFELELDKYNQGGNVDIEIWIEDFIQNTGDTRYGKSS